MDRLRLQTEKSEKKMQVSKKKKKTYTHAMEKRERPGALRRLSSFYLLFAERS